MLKKTCLTSFDLRSISFLEIRCEQWLEMALEFLCCFFFFLILSILIGNTKSFSKENKWKQCVSTEAYHLNQELVYAQ